MQRDDDWFRVRAGKVTASRIADVLARIKSGAPAATRTAYMAQLAAERLTGTATESYTSPAMQWGIDNEAAAVARYEAENMVTVTAVDFVLHPTISFAGASPDGLVGDDGLCEIKCPHTHTHIATMLSGKIDSKYTKQMQWQMACTGRSWCDYVSFDPRLPLPLDYWCKRVERDDAVIADMQDQVQVFLDELQQQVDQLNALR